MDNIIYHNSQRVSNTVSRNVKSGIINPLDRNTFKQLININSRFRNNYSITLASDFDFTLSTPIKKIVSMKVLSINLPAIIYTVSKYIGSNSFLIGNTEANIPIYIPDGTYTGNDIANKIKDIIASTWVDSSANPVNVEYSYTTGKITFTRDISFVLDFNYIDPSFCPNRFSSKNSNIYNNQLTLGWLLGFRKNYKYRSPATFVINNCYNNYNNNNNNNNNNFTYSNSNTYIGESPYDITNNRYFLLSINDFQNNHNISLVSPFQEETLNDGNLLAKISSCCNSCNNIEAPTRIYFGPTDISKLHIKLYDEFGRIVNLNNGDYSISLEVEILYDL